VYAEDTPQTLGVLELVSGVLRHLRDDSKIWMRWVLVIFVWGVMLPIAARWTWQFFFEEWIFPWEHEFPFRRLTWDCFEGIVLGLVVFCIVLAILGLRDFILANGIDIADPFIPVELEQPDGEGLANFEGQIFDDQDLVPHAEQAPDPGAHEAGQDAHARAAALVERDHFIPPPLGHFIPHDAGNSSDEDAADAGQQGRIVGGALLRAAPANREEGARGMRETVGAPAAPHTPDAGPPELPPVAAQNIAGIALASVFGF